MRRARGDKLPRDNSRPMKATTAGRMAAAVVTQGGCHGHEGQASSGARSSAGTLSSWCQTTTGFCVSSASR